MAKFTAASGSLYLNLYLETSGQPNVEANSSNVYWRVTVSRTGAYYTYNHDGSSTLTVDVNGSRVNTSNPSWQTSGEEFTLASGTTTVGHNPDGTKTVSASASFNPNNGVHGPVSVSGSLTLPTILRASSVSIGATTIGSAVTLTVSRASTSFTHTLRYAWGTTSGTIATGVGTSATWTPPMSLCEHIPSTTSGNGTIYVDTYSGSTMIGTKSIPFTASVPESVKPTFTSVTLTDMTSSTASLITGNNFVEILSNIKVTWNGASGAYGSTITGYKAEIVNKNITVNTNGGSFGPLNFDGNYTIRASVVDSRGRWSDTKDYSIVLLNYHAPALSFTVQRAGANMDKFVVVRNAMVAPLTVGTTQMNTMNLSYSVAPLGSTTFTADTGGGGAWTTLSTLTNSETTLNGTYAPNKSWVVRGILSDKFLSYTFEATVSTEGAIYYYDKDGRFGVGKVADSTIPPGSLDVAGNAYAQGVILGHYSVNHISDLNQATKAGIYHFTNISTNQPFGKTEYGYVEVIVTSGSSWNGSSNWIWQKWRSTLTEEIFERRRINAGDWTPWKIQGLDSFYPIGAIYESTSPNNPSTFMGGTWERFGNGRVLVGIDEGDGDFNTPNKTGGAKTHTLTVDQIPPHSHAQYVTANNGTPAIRRDYSSDGGSVPYPQGINTGNTGGGQAHNNLQPYVTVYRWRRIA